MITTNALQLSCSPFKTIAINNESITVSFADLNINATVSDMVGFKFLLSGFIQVRKNLENPKNLETGVVLK